MSAEPSYLVQWGLFTDSVPFAPGELKWVRQGNPLPRSWRGFVAAYNSREEARNAWTPGHFVRQIAESDDVPNRHWAVNAGESADQ